MQPRDLLFYMPKAAMNAPFTREQALEFFDMLCHELRYSWSSRARVPVDTIARICIALPDQLHRVAKLVVAYGDSRDFAEDMKYLKTLAPDVFSKLFVEINAFVPTYIFSDYENFQDFMEDYSTGTMDAALICLAQETARLRPQACPSASSFADIRKLAMRFIVNGCVTFPKTTPVATVETVQKWYDDFVGLLVNNPDPRFDEYETQSLCDLTMLMVDGGYYELVSYFPMQWVYKETSRNIKRARLVDAIEEERAKRRKVA